LHGSPDYPWFTGNESEKGEGEGEGFNINIPLSKDTDDDDYLKVLKKVIDENIKPYNANYLIVSLGGKLLNIYLKIIGIDLFTDL
jgi:acetoin utilization deacetylase AcuC-like enzyme